MQDGKLDLQVKRVLQAVTLLLVLLNGHHLVELELMVKLLILLPNLQTFCVNKTMGLGAL
jgi:hypothetical protein